MHAPGVEPTVRSFLQFQRQLPTLDRRFGFIFSLKGSFTLSGLFLGSASEALQLLQAAQLLDDLDPGSPSDVPPDAGAQQYPYGLVLQPLPSYAALAAEVSGGG